MPNRPPKKLPPAILLGKQLRQADTREQHPRFLTIRNRPVTPKGIRRDELPS